MSAPRPRPYDVAAPAAAPDLADGGGSALRLLLDGRPARTPGGRPLVAPASLAAAVAAEWNAQVGLPVLADMPLTRLLMRGLDLDAAAAPALRGAVARYLDTDLLCCRAEAPAALVAAQAAAWDPLLDWAAGLGLAPTPTTSLTPPPAAPPLRAAAEASLAEAAGPTLVALKEVADVSGSAVVAFAAWRSDIDPGALFDASQIDERFQADRWGRDAEAEARTARLRRDFLAAASILRADA